MIHNVKTLGLMVVAALAMSAMFASAAQAEGALGTFTAGDTTVGADDHTGATIIGEQYGLENETVNYFEAFGSKTTCTNAGTKLTGTVANGTATTLTMTPDLKDCKTGGLPATVTTNGCDFTLTRPTTVAPLGTGTYTGQADEWCPHNTRIDIEVYLFGGVTSHFGGVVCTILVGNAGGTHTILGGHIIYSPGVKKVAEPDVTKDDITAKATATGIPASRSGSGCATESVNNGIYNNTSTLTAKDDVTDEFPHATEHLEYLDLWISDEFF